MSFRNALPLAVAENVVGLISAAQGEHYRKLHNALIERGYKVGAVVIDASHWVPQSRKRGFCHRRGCCHTDRTI